MNADQLRSWDSNQDFACFIAKRAGLEPRKDVRQNWVVDGAALTVEWALDRRTWTVLFVRSGWPPTTPATISLCLAEVFAIATTGQLRKPSGPSLARWKIRALLEAGLIPRPDIALPRLPHNAPSVAQRTWAAIEVLLSVRAVRGDTDPIPLVASFLTGWSGNTLNEAEARAGREWLERHEHIVHVANGPGRFGKPTKLWRVGG